MSDLLTKLSAIHDRREEVGKQLADPDVIADRKRFVDLNREYRDLEPVDEAYGKYRRAMEDLRGAEAMLRSERDAEMLEMARAEKSELTEVIETMEEEIRLLLVPKDPNDERNCSMEIRAGTGGDEAGIFAGDLLRMYTRYCEGMGWKVEVADISENSAGGCLLYTSPSPRDRTRSRMPSSA